MNFTTTELSPDIGTRIDTDADTLVSGARTAEIRELLEYRGVLVFPQIHLSDAQQLAFSRTIGEVIDQGEEGIFKISLDTEVSDAAGYLLGTILWHVDGWADDVPTRGSILSARKLSAKGGQTEFANTYAAYQALPEERKRALLELRACHTMAATQRDVYPDASPEMRALWERNEPKTHPLVWTHRSGRRSLFLGASTDWIHGMDPGESRALIEELLAWCTQSRFVYRHEWQLGDLLIWDNCGVMHRVEPYAADSGRLMHRTTLVGEEPVA